MRKKKVLAVLIVVLLLIATVIPAVATGRAFPVAQSGSDTEDTTTLPAAPAVTVTGVNVVTASGKDTGFFELGLEVSAQQFQSVGVVLAYDTRVLSPVLWTDDTPVEVSGKSWDTPTVLPTKGADGLSGKPALAYTEYTSPEDDTAPIPTDWAYLYLGADALQYTSLSGERVVTVRFAYVGTATKADVTMPVDGAHTPTTGHYTVELASAQVASAAIPGARLLATTGGGMDGTPMVYKYGDTIGTGEDATTYTVKFEFGDGPSVNTGTAAGGGGGYAITFFDWDGRVIDAISAEQDATTAVDDWMARQVIIDRLGNKAGYRFDCWLVVKENNDGQGLRTEKDTFTSNDTSVKGISADEADFSDLSAYADVDNGGYSVLVQAAYVAKSAANGDSADLVNGGKFDNTDKYYTISEPVYTRYGAADAIAGSYSLTMTVTRRQQDGTTGVTRLREPAIWVAMTPTGGGANILNLIRLENTDETTFEIVTTKQIATVSYKVIDVYGVSNWPGCADKSALGAKGKNDCVRLGTLGYLANQAYSVYKGGAWEATVNNWAFADSFTGLTGSVNTTRANTAYWTEAKCTAAKTALKNRTTTLGRLLTYDEVLQVLQGV